MSKTNGTNGTAAASRFDPNFTAAVINATGPKANPRLKQLVGGLVQHLHDFLRENEVTLDEYFAAIDMINRAGQMSNAKRNEGQLLSDILGMESLCDEITSTLAAEAADQPTATAILGPFWRKDAPAYAMGDSIVKGFPDADHTLMHGRVLDFDTGTPIANAEVDIWHTAPNGLYESQDPEQPDMNLRGRFHTGPDGRYSLYCLRPTKYPIPDDGPAGELLGLLDRHPWRPAHIHFIISAEGYKSVVTQIFDRRDEHITDDVAFAVKESLVVDFAPRQGDPKGKFELEYDFKLVSFEAGKKYGMPGAKNA
ncbi:catechol 1,2-dioxygenase 1 [Neohortaea acidophila]|uniref:Catechol 1,2-dioxygenase 1 n=1 Tax=Neohortaea acidophila TaxID=245834 RepID=A0A6A6Q1V5_9PEZI|nr:catechol 1,2-dioxygenase 1 [Neohortaea acidophila]KAF2485966.1 catechol 1,2-dioxygenase 1 [Neohortaea acidophila]